MVCQYQESHSIYQYSFLAFRKVCSRSDPTEKYWKSPDKQTRIVQYNTVSTCGMVNSVIDQGFVFFPISPSSITGWQNVFRHLYWGFWHLLISVITCASIGTHSMGRQDINKMLSRGIDSVTTDNYHVPSVERDLNPRMCQGILNDNHLYCCLRF